MKKFRQFLQNFKKAKNLTPQEEQQLTQIFCNGGSSGWGVPAGSSGSAGGTPGSKTFAQQSPRQQQQQQQQTSALQQLQQQLRRIQNEITTLQSKIQRERQPLQKQSFKVELQQKKIEERQVQQQVKMEQQKQKLDQSAAIGGVLFIDEAHNLEPGKGLSGGKDILNEILDVSETQRDDLTIILAGYTKRIEEEILAADPGLSSRFPYHWEFEDFTEDELRSIFEHMVKKNKWSLATPKCAKVAAQRLSVRRGREGFGNARDVRVLFEKSYKNALARMARTSEKPGELKIVDVLGPRPDEKRGPLAAALLKLDHYIGLKAVKETIKNLIKSIQDGYDTEMGGGDPLKLALNRMFLGNPGTGKTSVAKIYGEILKRTGLLSNGAVVETTASDFVGNAEGVTKTNTKRILQRAKGKVLVIDEAYALNDQNYGKEALDTIVEKVGTNNSTRMHGCSHHAPVTRRSLR